MLLHADAEFPERIQSLLQHSHASKFIKRNYYKLIRVDRRTLIRQDLEAVLVAVNERAFMLQNLPLKLIRCGWILRLGLMLLSIFTLEAVAIPASAHCERRDSGQYKNSEYSYPQGLSARVVSM